MTVEFSQIAILAFASVFAGFIDSVVGGGGLIQIPAIFSVLPKELPATLFGTNKIASVFGTANAAWRYSGRVAMPWGTTLPAAAAPTSMTRIIGRNRSRGSHATHIAPR